MPSYSPHPFTLDEAHVAATAAGFKPTRLGEPWPVQFQLPRLPRGRRQPRRLLGR